MQTADLLDLIKVDPDMSAILGILRDLDLKDSWLAAGSVRNFIWNHLSGKPRFDATTDVDVVFFDPDISYEDTVAIEERLRTAYPQYQWELKNQVYMHSHSPGTLPYRDARDAISKYPEQCTAVALRLTKTGQVELYCPYGLEDILTFRLRPTPHFASHPDRMQVYRERLDQKNWQQKWPLLREKE